MDEIYIFLYSKTNNYNLNMLLFVLQSTWLWVHQRISWWSSISAACA